MEVLKFTSGGWGKLVEKKGVIVMMGMGFVNATPLFYNHEPLADYIWQ